MGLLQYFLYISQLRKKSKLWAACKTTPPGKGIFTVYIIDAGILLLVFFAGIFFFYLIFQMALWWIFHTSILLWKVFFPFYSQTFTASGKIKHVHVLCLIIGLILPLATVITSLSEFAVESRNKVENGTSALDLFVTGDLGYTTISFPPILCFASDKDAGFYSLILPLSIFQAIGGTMLILIVWHIHRVSCTQFN